MNDPTQPRSTLTPSRRLAIALWCLIGSFTTLVPGGPIETRDFSQLSPEVFWGFNAFLIGLGLVSLGMSYGAWRERPWAAWGAIPVTGMYLGVFILDWAQVFPPTADSMALNLALVELFGATCAIAGLAFASRSLAARHDRSQ